MKLLHRDFRPPRRSKYVAQPLKRRPTLRILLLVAIGVAVYWKFDAVVSSQAFQRLLKPSSLFQSFIGSEKPAVFRPSDDLAENWRWTRDSSYLEAKCDSPDYRVCLETWKEFAGSDLGGLRALIGKAAAQWGIEPTGGFTVRYRPLDSVQGDAAGALSGLELSGLDIRTVKGLVSLKRSPGKPAFCANGKCLDEIHPSPPFSEFLRASTPDNPDGRENHPTEAMLTPLQSPVFRPVLDGRIVDASTDWVKIYHGRNLFSHYRGFARLRAGLRPGSMVRAGDTLGYVAAAGDSLLALGIHIEKDGLAVDPIAFLGLRGDSAARRR